MNRHDKKMRQIKKKDVKTTENGKQPTVPCDADCPELSGVTAKLARQFRPEGERIKEKILSNCRILTPYSRGDKGESKNFPVFLSLAAGS
jgi:hypothetical protein